MDAGLTAVSKRRKTKDGKMNSLKCRYTRHMFVCVGGAQISCPPLVKISQQRQLTKACFISLLCETENLGCK